MTTFDAVWSTILLPADFTWLDEKTLLTHQGAMWVRPEGEKGRVVGYTTLCTETRTYAWREKPDDAKLTVTCFGCLGAHEQ